MAAQWTRWRGGERTEGREGDDRNFQAVVDSRGSSDDEMGWRVVNPNMRVTLLLFSRRGLMPAS
jgi:hypothetical protein